MIRAAINPPMWLDHEKTRMLREADAMTFDPETNRVPWELLKPEEQAALRKWPHGLELYSGGEWEDWPEPVWIPGSIYRGKPAPPEPKRHVFHGNFFIWGLYKQLEDTHRIIITEHPDGSMTAEVEAL